MGRGGFRVQRGAVGGGGPCVRPRGKARTTVSLSVTCESATQASGQGLRVQLKKLAKTMRFRSQKCVAVSALSPGSRRLPDVEGVLPHTN